MIFLIFFHDYNTFIGVEKKYHGIPRHDTWHFHLESVHEFRGGGIPGLSCIFSRCISNSKEIRGKIDSTFFPLSIFLNDILLSTLFTSFLIIISQLNYKIF